MKTKGYSKKYKGNFAKELANSGNRYRRKQDKQWSITPTWVDKLMVVFKYAIHLTPILCCIIATWVDPSLYTKWMMTAVYTLSLSLIIQLTEK